MRKNLFLERYESINKNLVGQVVSRAFNSVGSHVFFYFGELRETVLPNGKKTTDCDWIIWVGASWRISRYGSYVIGADDFPEEIEEVLQRFIGKCFKSMMIISQCLEVSFQFDDGYEITTFFNASSENQWTVLFPQKKSKISLEIDFSNIRNKKQAKEIAKCFVISEEYHEIDLIQNSPILIEIEKDESKYFFRFENDLCLQLNNCVWRIEKKEQFLFGCFDGTSKNRLQKLDFLIGKKLQSIKTLNLFMDGKLEFEEGYVLKTFSCIKQTVPWKISSQDKVIFKPQVPIEQTSKSSKQRPASVQKPNL